MKNSIITRYASFLLVIGFFISCSSSKFSADDLISEGNYQQALDEISTELSKNPSASLYFLKGKVHGLVALENTADTRNQDYQMMVEAFDSSMVFQSQLPDNQFNTEIDSLIYYYWDLEHQFGLAEYGKNSDQGLVNAINHFNNAITIDNERIESYKSLSITLYNSEDIDGAITTLKNAESISSNDLEVFENLGFLYLETGNPEESILYYEKANQNPLKNKNIAFGLVNAYISQDKNTQANSLLEQLVKEYPKESKLRNVYGTQLYNQISQLFPTLNNAYSSNDSTTVETLRVEIEGLSENAENQLIEAYKMNPSSIEFTESLAVFYNNMSGNYFSSHKVAFDSDKNNIKTKALSLTDFAIDYYEKLKEMNIDNTNYSTKIKNLTTLKNSWNTK